MTDASTQQVAIALADASQHAKRSVAALQASAAHEQHQHRLAESAAAHALLADVVQALEGLRQ